MPPATFVVYPKYVFDVVKISHLHYDISTIKRWMPDMSPKRIYEKNRTCSLTPTMLVLHVLNIVYHPLRSDSISDIL